VVGGVSTARRGGRARRRVEPGRVAREVRVRQTLAAIAPEPRWKKPHRRAGRAPPGLRRRERAVRATGVGTRTCVGISSLCRCLAAYLRRVRKRAPMCARPELLGEASLFRAALPACAVVLATRAGSARAPVRRRSSHRCSSRRLPSSHRRAAARRVTMSLRAALEKTRDAAARVLLSRFARSSVDARPAVPPAALWSQARGAKKSTRRVDVVLVQVRPSPPPVPPARLGRRPRPRPPPGRPHRHVPRVAIPPRAEPLTPGARALERARPPALT